jgi:GT2 family glycosyltransferase
MGLTLIRREVLEDLGADHEKLWPFAETIVDGRALGEDVTFCLRAKEKGYQTWLCGDARAGHAKTFIING